MDPLEQARLFLDCFQTTANPDDPLPAWVPIYHLKQDEIEPAIIDWIKTYLDQFGCPQCILPLIIRTVLEEVLSNCKENPKSCGLNGQEYNTLQLNHEVILRVNQTCLGLLDNAKLNNLLAQLGTDQPDGAAGGGAIAPGPKVHFSRGLKHRRRTMEDRHVCLPDFNTLFRTKDTEPTAFYGVYDGHGGQEAASFAASYLHYYIAQSEHYPHDMEQAFRDGFLKTDQLFLEKCENHHLNSGSTAVACVHHTRSQRIDVAWVGDSQAILVRRNPGEGVYKPIVHPTHVASDPDERERIDREGGCVIPWNGQFRVSGQLAITRAIGNRFYKPYVTANPAVSLNQCTEDDLLLILASDGLWEGYNEYLTSMFVLYAIRKFPDDPQKVTDCLISFAKHKTRDNITVIIVFLKDPQTIIKETPFIEQIEAKARLRSSQNMEINEAASNGFLAENNAIGMEDHKTYDDIQNFMVESAMLEPKSAASTLCVGPMDDMGFLSDGGLGPETDVDGVHDSKQQSPSPLLEEAVKSAELLDNGDMMEHETAHAADSGAEEPQHHHNPFAQSLNVPLDLAPSMGMGEAANTTDYEEEEPTSPSSLSAADPPVDLSEEDQLVHAVPHVNGNGEHHHYDELTETIGDELVGGGDGGDGASEKLDAAEIVPALKAELNADELVPLKTIDEPIVNDLLGADAIVDNKLIDQLDSFGIPEAIRRQLIEQQQVSGGAAMLHEHDEDDDDGQLMMGEEKQSDYDGADDGAEKEDLHHEKVFDSDYGTDRHSADVKQDDDAGCCEDSEEDEWDYVKVNSEEQQQQQQHEQESQPAPEKQPEESTPSDENTLPVEYSSSINSFAPEEPPQQENDVLQQQQQPVQEVEQQQFEEQHQQQQEEEVEVNCEKEEQQQVEQTPAQESNEEEEDGAAEGRVVAEHHDEVAAVPNTNEPAAAVADILGDYAAESTVSESANEVDDVISSTGGETKEVVNLLNDFNEDVLPPAADAPVCDTNSETVNEEETSEPVVPAYDLPSDSVNMEASMYGGSVGDQPHSPETPMSPVENFPAQQQQQQYSHEKDMFGSGMDDTMSPTTDGEELNEKHLYETEEKSMNLLQQQQQQQDGSGGGDYGWSLNPEAKEFVPVTGSVGSGGAEINPKMHELREDAIVAQSPRKGTMSSMEDLDVPAETDFQTEMDKRPHEFEEYGGENGENGGADESGAGESHLRSPLTVHPFDLSEFNEQTVVEQQLLAGSGDMANGVGDYENAGADLLAQPTVADADAEMELLNKVQELPDDEEEKPQEPLVDAQEVAPVQAQYAHEEFDQLVKPEETYSAKEELSVEQKETVDISPSSVDLAHQMDNLMLEGGEMYHGRVEDYPADQVPRGASSDISQSPEFKMLQSSIEQQLGKTSGSSSPFAGGESELAAYHKEASALEASVYDPEPGLLSSQEPAASVDSSEPQASQNYMDLMGGAPDQKADPEPMVEAAKPQETAELPAEPEQPIATEEPQVVEAEKESADVAGTAVAAAAAAATVAVAAAAATAAATSKPTAKPKAPSTTAAKKTTASAKPSASAAVSKDSAATKSAATRVGSSSTTTAARKPLAKAPTSSSGPAAARTTTGKPSTDAAKAAPATKTTASSVAAARTKAASATSTTKTATSASSTTKAASASSVTRTAAPKPTTGSAGAAPKPSSRLSTASSTTTRTVTSRPSSAVSSASVPSKTSTTTTTTAKRTVAAKSSLTNGTSATDGAAARTTKTTTSSTVPRTGAATRTSATAGSGLAGKTSSSSTTAAAKKPLLDAKTTASKTASSSTAAGRTTTTTRTSLAPKAATAGATSPSVRKVQQNGVAAKKSTTSAVSPAPGTKKPAPITRPKGTATTAAAAPAAAKTNGVVGTVTEAAVPVDAAPVAVTSPPEQPEQQLPADQLLVPVPQAM